MYWILGKLGCAKMHGDWRGKKTKSTLPFKKERKEETKKKK